MRQRPFLLAVLGSFSLFAGLFLYLFTGLYIWSFSLLLFGAVLILLTHNSWKFKLLIVCAPLTFVAFSFYNSFTTPETYLIPENYKGPVVVVFNQKDGQPKEYAGRRRLYKIPPTGVLFTQFKDEQGWINQEYYYVTANGQRKKLEVLDTRDFNEEWTLVKNGKEPSRDSLAIIGGGSMGTMGNSGDPDSKIYSELFVGTYNDLKNFKEITPEYIDSLKNATKKKGY